MLVSIIIISSYLFLIRRPYHWKNHIIQDSEPDSEACSEVQVVPVTDLIWTQLFELLIAFDQILNIVEIQRESNFSAYWIFG
jgi:hypothetical protein